MPDPNLAHEVDVLRKAGFSKEDIEAYAARVEVESEIEPPSEFDANVVRYGLPAAVGLVGGPLAVGATALASEALARGLSPTTHEESGVTTALHAAGAGVTGWFGARYLEPVASRVLSKLGNPLRKGVKNFLVGKELPTEQRVLFNVLEELGSTPSLGQISPKGFAQRIDDIVRSSMGGREISKKLDQKNIQLIEDAITEYLDTFAKVAHDGKLLDANGIPRQLAKRKYGELFRKIVLDEIKLGQEAVGALYNRYNLLVEPENLRVPAESILKTLKDNKNNMFMRRVMPKIKPWLTTEKTAVSDPALDRAMADISEETLMEFDDAAVESFITTLAEMFKTEKTIPLENATEIMRVLNPILRGKVRGDAAMAGKLKGSLDQPMRQTMRKVPDAEAAYDAAQTAYGQLADRLYNNTVKNLIKTATDKPSTLVNTFLTKDSGYDALLATKAAISRGTVGRITYQQDIIQPLRHQVITESIERGTGRFSGEKFARVLDKIGPDMADEIFGPQASARLRNFAAALTSLQRSGKGNTVWVQLMQGGMILQGAAALTAAGGLAYDYMDNDDKGKRLAIPALVVFMSPVLLTKLTANPQRLHALITGLEAGPGTQAFGRLSALSSALLAKESITGATFTAARDDFYNPSTPEETQHIILDPEQQDKAVVPRTGSR